MGEKERERKRERERRWKIGRERKWERKESGGRKRLGKERRERVLRCHFGLAERTLSFPPSIFIWVFPSLRLEVACRSQPICRPPPPAAARRRPPPVAHKRAMAGKTRGDASRSSKRRERERERKRESYSFCLLFCHVTREDG